MNLGERTQVTLATSRSHSGGGPPPIPSLLPMSPWNLAPFKDWKLREHREQTLLPWNGAPMTAQLRHKDAPWGVGPGKSMWRGRSVLQGSAPVTGAPLVWWEDKSRSGPWLCYGAG